MTLIIASNNAHKIREIREILGERFAEILSLSDAGIPFDRKRFSPHITVIRRASYGGKDKYPAVEIPAAGMTVERISLMRSDRGKHGMIYTELGCIHSTDE